MDASARNSPRPPATDSERWTREETGERLEECRLYRSGRRPTVMVLALTAMNGQSRALPPCTHCLPQAERFHKQAVGKTADGRRIDCPEITGRAPTGAPLRENHDHVHTVPVDLDGDGRLDHILIYARRGVGEQAEAGIRRIRATYGGKRGAKIRVSFVGQWYAGEAGSVLERLPGEQRGRLASLFAYGGGSRVWTSVTPFVPPRYLKPRGKHTLAGQVNAELAVRGFPAASRVEFVSELTRDLCRYVRRRRDSTKAPPIDVAFGLRLELPIPITGPLLLGYASHYGLGLFRCVES